MNSLGVPQFRRIRGMAVFKLPNESWCRGQYYAYFQDYEGRKFGKTCSRNGPEDGTTTICSCP